VIRSLLVSSIAFSLLAGCGRAPAPSRAASQNAAPRSPRETVDQLLSARTARAYQKMKPLIVDERADDVVATLLAVDEFLAANRDLCETVRDRVGVGLAQSIDQSEIGRNLEIFSAYVELLDVTIAGDEATVGFLVDGRLPAKHAKLRRVGGQWRYDPQEGYDSQIPAAFHRMARGLRQATTEITSGRLAADALRADPQRLINEVRLRLMPGVKMLRAPLRSGGG
jgi:hypothetical protein